MKHFIRFLYYLLRVRIHGPRVLAEHKVRAATLKAVRDGIQRLIDKEHANFDGKAPHDERTATSRVFSCYKARVQGMQAALDSTNAQHTL